LRNGYWQWVRARIHFHPHNYQQVLPIIIYLI